MTTNYPGAIDSYTRPTSGTKRSVAPTETTVVDNLYDAVEAIEGELGVNPSGSSATVVARLDAADAAMGSTISGGDARALADVNTTNGSAVITSATAAWTAADVGRSIAIRGGGGGNTKLLTTIASRQSSTQVTLAAPASATLTNTTAQVGTDFGPALQAALNATAAAGGGRVVIAPGDYMITTAVSTSFANLAAHVVIDGAGAKLYIACLASSVAVSIASCHELVINNLAFVGLPVERNDALVALQVTGCNQATLNNLGFYGLSSIDTSSGSILQLTNSDVRLNQCFFGGCVANSAANMPIVDILNWVGFVADGCRFIDYGQVGTITHSKTGIAAPQAWIKIGSQLQTSMLSVLSGGAATVRNCKFDEGAIYSVLVNPAAGRVSRFVMQNCDSNVSTSGAGAWVRLTDQATIEDCFFGYAASGTRDAVQLTAVTTARLRRVLALQNANRITADGGTGRVLIEDCTYTSLSLGTAVATITTTGKQLGATGSRPAAATVGAGAQFYDTTLGKPIWSDGTNWKDAAGTTV